MKDIARALLNRIRGGKALTGHPICRGLHGSADTNKPVIFLTDEWPGRPEHRPLTDEAIAHLQHLGFLGDGFEGHVVRVDAGDHYEAWWVLDSPTSYRPV